MSLKRLQREIEQIYRLNPNPSVDQFLLTKKDVLSLRPETPKVTPQVLVHQKEGEVALGVHVGDEALKRIKKSGIEKATLADFCSATEEVSHFTYLIWSAQNEKKVSMLDLEIQGEIDKFILATHYFKGKVDVFSALFERFSIEKEKTEEERARYLEANRLAGKFCKGLGDFKTSLKTLRDFYRRASHFRLAWLSQLSG